MAQVIVEYGPPARQGVMQIMGLGEDEYMEPVELTASDAIRKVGRFGVGLWVAGLVVGNDKLRNIGLGGALASIAIAQVTKIPGAHPVLTLLQSRSA